ncbi:hypothetical protein JKI95_07950 [Corynebacterium aquatimens]|uniref:hypothetical protein n=1 Tax=Corynebacterium aquatimens TaxID=1190508 RepID=UPI002540823A|nr:hypothetical protein [Corynebacterium aquatimens]QYH19158.1 hypothetical protein JKI95_07950 [Corynebacterium aquatimens]
MGANTAGAGAVQIVALGTGTAAAKAIVFSLLEQEIRPDVECILAADRPEELYEIAPFAALAATQPWLRVTCATTHDGTWPRVGGLGRGKRASSSIERKVAAVETLLTAPEVVLCGPEARVRELRASVPRASVIAHDAEPDWSTPAD